MIYNQIVSAVFCFQQSLTKNFTEQNTVNIPKQCRECTEKVKSAQIYKHLITCTNQTPTSQSKWIEYYPFLEKADWQSIYTLVSKLTNIPFWLHSNLRSCTGYLTVTTNYSRTSIIWPSIIRISRLTEPKSCLRTGSTYNEQPSVSNITGFYTFSETINSSAL